MVKVEEQDVLGLRQLSLKIICTHVIIKYGILHFSTLIRVVESCTMALIQHPVTLEAPKYLKYMLMVSMQPQ